MTTAQPDPIAEDLRAIELASVATSIAKAAQPGQEQRMVTDAMIEAALEVVDGVDNSACERIYLAMHAARPTADLGEDGELVELSERLTDTACVLRGRRMRDHAVRCASAAVALSKAADRLILYREALVAARPYVEANASRDSRMTAHHKGADVLDMIDAVLSRSGG